VLWLEAENTELDIVLAAKSKLAALSLTIAFLGNLASFKL
jgi:hypothetical protein